MRRARPIAAALLLALASPLGADEPARAAPGGAVPRSEPAAPAPGAGNPAEVFRPSEQITADTAVDFPVDI